MFHYSCPQWFRNLKILLLIQLHIENSCSLLPSLPVFFKLLLDYLGKKNYTTYIRSKILFYVYLQILTRPLINNRLGFLVDFLSHAAIVGFMAGAACVIGLQQLKSLLGISNFTNNTDIISVLASICKSINTVNSQLQYFLY